MTIPEKFPTFPSVAITQPTFLPWIGFFALMLQSDAFIFLDSVQFVKRSWLQRNKIKTANGPLWLTVPVLTKGAHEQSIPEALIDQEGNWSEKMVRTLQQNYSKAPYYKTYADPLRTMLTRKDPSLVNLNLDLIHWFMEQLGIHVPTFKASDLPVSGKKAELLASICACYGAKNYISALGAKDYIDESDAFQRNNIEVIYTKYQPTPYRQLYGEFEAYYSIVDLLFNEGPHSLEIIRQGLQSSA